MKYTSAFDIIGPIMVGPSSSHTAGAVRIGNLARQVLAEEPRDAEFRLMGSFAETYMGHGTDLALLAGVLGMTTDSPNVPNANVIAEERQLAYSFVQANIGDYHPNTVEICLEGATRKVTLIGSSIGGGKVEVQALDELPVKFSGERSTLILYHMDEPGFLVKVLDILLNRGCNIVRLALERWNRGGNAITVCETDEHLDEDIVSVIRAQMPNLKHVCLVKVV